MYAGRTLVFANDTGVSLDGRVLLNSAEVRHNWLDVSKNKKPPFFYGMINLLKKKLVKLKFHICIV